MGKTANSATPITDKEIDNVKVVQPSAYYKISPEELRKKHQEVLRYARDHNESKEVAFAFSEDLQRVNQTKGDVDAAPVNTYGLESKIFVMHNHPKNVSYSNVDVLFLITSDEVGALSIVKNNGHVELLEKTGKYTREIATKCYCRAIKSIDPKSDEDYNKVVKDFIKRAKKEDILAWTIN